MSKFLNRNKAPLDMNYTLNKPVSPGQKGPGVGALKDLLPLLAKEKTHLIIALIGILVNTVATLVAPMIIGSAVDNSIQSGDWHGVLVAAGMLLAVYAAGLIASYNQTIHMGTVGRRVLFDLRNEIFIKLQELPVAFFNQNKVGDLISRINNDTDRLSQFFAQALMQFVGNFFIILGAGIFLISLNVKLGLAALLPALGVLIATRLLSPWVKRKNAESLQSVGDLSAEVQESLSNYKVIIAFNRLDYFRTKFNTVNETNYTASIKAGVANNVFIPIYTLASTLGQLIVLAYGIVLISQGNFTVGLLIGFLLYVNSFYLPLRQIASIWSTFQQSLAALERISELRSLSSDLPILPLAPSASPLSPSVLAFYSVSFRYPDGKDVLKRISFELEAGKTYALVGPTGGGKTTTASLMARLYDATEGTIELHGRDIRTYSPEERSTIIGFILQEPFLFTGTVLDNVFYGHPELGSASKADREKALEESGLGGLLINFENGLNTELKTGGDSISLGQRQLIAFVRAVLRKPALLILDEATANIDTVTEQLLEQVLAKLPSTTTKVIIAHRLNTIENADEIFFVNGGEISAAGSLDHAIELLMHGKRES